MPKVSEDYVKKKKDSIVAAALKVCKEKPLYEITMTDIIKETGISQGGIYRYFSNLDEILIEVINKANSNINYKDDIDEILAKRDSAAEKINDMLIFLGKYIKENVKTMGKFQFELTVLLANHPDRYNKFMSQVNEEEKSQYLIDKINQTINEGIDTGEFAPGLSVQDIYSFIISSIDGIVRDTVLHNCYNLNGNDNFKVDEVVFMKTLSKSIILILTENK